MKVIPPWQVINHNISMNTKEIFRDKMTQDFSSEVHLLDGKLVPVVAIHPLGGSHANRHHTSNPQPGVAQPTQNRDHTSHVQSTRVAFGAPPGKTQEPLTITGRWPRIITNSCHNSSAAPSRLGIGKHQE
jgi:hypothetical protein